VSLNNLLPASAAVLIKLLNKNLSSLLIGLTVAAAKGGRKVSCKISNNAEYGKACRLENVNAETEVEIDTQLLKYVYFDHSEIEGFTKPFLAQLKGIEYFNANSIDLEYLNGEILSGLDSIIGFWAAHNSLKSLNAYTFAGNQELELIYLKFNRIDYIHENAFVGLDNLYVLDLSSNNLKEISNAFDSLHQLVRLDLSSNLIESFDESIFDGLPHLMELNLQKNNIKLLDPAVFNPLRNLQYINLSFNKSPIEVIPGNLFALNYRLRRLHLTGNGIKGIDRQFFMHDKPNLELVSFRQNSCVNDDVELLSNATISRSQLMKFKMCYEKFRLQ